MAITIDGDLSQISQKKVVEILRGLFQKPKERMPCIVCGKYACVSEFHHVIPVSQMASLLRQYKIQYHHLLELKVRYFWLCPNHHAIFHKLSSRKTGIKEIPNCIGEDEFRSLKPLFDHDYWDEFNKFLLEHYNENRTE